MNKQLSVRLFGEEIGILEQTSTGKMQFTYSDNTKTQISLSLPLEKKTFTDKECKPYFNGLLPESENSRKYIGKIFSINSNNDFLILKAIGHDCAGALSLHDPQEPIIKADFIELKGEPQTQESLAKHIENLPKKPFFTDKNNEVRLSLAGAQDKACICIINNEICIPKNSSPTTHILKPLIKDLKDSILNEYFCMKIAKSIGIQTPNVEIRHAKDIPFLLIERYDREIKNNFVRRIHQEDFCQAMGILSIDKYQSDGGLDIKKCFTVLDKTKVPVKNRISLMQMIMFNFLIGNNDAHGKNFSLIYNDQKPNLSPAYDLLSSEVYPSLSKKMAMKIGSTYEKEWINKDNWKSMCESAQYSLPLFTKEFLSLCELLPANMKKEIEELEVHELDTEIPKTILNITKSHCQTIIKTLE